MEDNCFDEITFDEIVIDFCSNLSVIERNAFNATELVTKRLTLMYNDKLIMDNSTFEQLSSFKNIEVMEVFRNGFHEIPSKAFLPINGYQEKLKNLSLGQDFTKMGNKAFSNLKNLAHLSFESARFKSLPDYAFEFEEHSNQTFHLLFWMDLNISSAFNEKTLLNIRRPTTLYLRDLDSVQYLPEKVFLPFLLENETKLN